MGRIACFGEALIDFLALPPADPREARTFLQQAGGAPANVAVGLARLGSDAEFIGMLSCDMFGDFLLAELRGAGVGTTHVQRSADAPTALAFVALDAHGERSFSFRRPPAADLLFDEGALDADAFAGLRILHACSNSLTEAAIAEATFACQRRAREAGALVCFDMNLRPALWPRDVDPLPRITRALALADVIKLASDELAFLATAGDDERAVVERLLLGRARLVVVTDGARPLRWFTRGGNGVLASIDVTALDTTAAGDAFSAGLLHAIVRQGVDAGSLDEFVVDTTTLIDALRFASACGALAVTRRGAFSAMPSHDEVAALLARPPDHGARP